MNELGIDTHRYYSWRRTLAGLCIVLLPSLWLGAWLYFSDYEIDQPIYPRSAARMNGFTKKLCIVPDVRGSQTSKPASFGSGSRPVGAEGTPAGEYWQPTTIPDSVWLARWRAMPRYREIMIPVVNYEFCDDYPIRDVGPNNESTWYVVSVMKYVRQEIHPKGEWRRKRKERK